MAVGRPVVDGPVGGGGRDLAGSGGRRGRGAPERHLGARGGAGQGGKVAGTEGDRGHQADQGARRREHLTALAMLIAVPAAARAPLLFATQFDYDEGVYWQSLRALAAGHRLFAEVYSSQPPGFLVLLTPFYDLLGRDLLAARAGAAMISLAGVAAAYALGVSAGGRAVGLAAGALVALDPLLLRESVALQAEGPAIALALVAIALAASASLDHGRRSVALAAGAGAALAAGGMVKLLDVTAAAPVALLLLTPGPRIARLAAATAAGLAAALALLAPFLVDLRPLLEQGVGLHLSARAVNAGGLTPDMWSTVWREIPMAALGALGLVAGRRSMLTWAGLAWLVADVAFVFAQRPLWPHHLVVVAAPLALIAAGLARSWSSPAAVAAAVAAVLAVGALAVWQVTAQLPPSTAPQAERFAKLAAPGRLVITDDQFTAALADRDVPSELVDTSFVRAWTGSLTLGEVQDAVMRHRVCAVLVGTGRFDQVPGLDQWLAASFPRRIDLGMGRRVYSRPCDGA
jgi:4-amino-4-deoxy-L-arabinose transferase-like glycosyltransferase